MMSPAQIVAAACRVAVPLALFLALGCGSSGPNVAMYDAATLRAERIEYRGQPSDLLILRRGIHAVVRTAVDPSSVTSQIAAHTAVTRFSNHGQPERVAALTPDTATLVAIHARIIASTGEIRPVTATDVVEGADGARVDPSQTRWELVFPPLVGDAVLEVVAHFEVPGTLASDAQFLSSAAGPTRELLLRYDVDMDADISFSVVGTNQFRPVITTKDGQRLVALLVNDQPKREPSDGVHARFVTTRVSPKNYTTELAMTWPQATAAYATNLVDISDDLREGYAPPFESALPDRQGVDELYTWVRDRIQRDDAMTATWRTTGSLIKKVETNDLTQTDKVHLLRWLLYQAKVPSVLAIARPNTLPTIKTENPAPGLFSVPLVYVPAYTLWLDPACQTCEAGALRPDLAGAQVITLPATPAGPTRLPQ